MQIKGNKFFIYEKYVDFFSLHVPDAVQAILVQSQVGARLEPGRDPNHVW